MGCNLCPRGCGKNRTTEKGYCGADNDVYVARAAAHMWEEPCISGESGSGTVFFSGCPLHCVFCQNNAISNGNAGKKTSVEELSEIFNTLQAEGLCNINLVTPTHYAPQIAQALKMSKLTIPVVYNTSGYETEQLLSMMGELVDVYMPDFKYFYASTAEKYSKAPNYCEVAKKALNAMFLQVKKPVFDKNGLMKKGVLVRHLVLPTHTLESKKIIEYLYETYGNDIYISIMNQYTPVRRFDSFPELNRKITLHEYNDVVRFAERLGVVNAFVQEGGTAKESFIPGFEE